ncbi:MAG: hypothetical protein AAF627_19550 [Myxococcota bacterium]
MSLVLSHPPGASPPPEALAACEAANEGDACTVQTPKGALMGTCRLVPEEVLACVPHDHRPPKR